MSDAELAATPLTHAAPQVSLDEVRTIATELYQLEGEITPLAGERDRNFRLLTAGGQSYMLRFINAAENRDEVDFQTALLTHVARRDPSLPVPRLISACDGKTAPTVYSGSRPLRLRTVTYLPGTPQYLLPRTAALMRSSGDTLARLDKALMDFKHPGAERDLLWNISELTRVGDWLNDLADNAQRREVARVLEQHQQLLPQLNSLRRQVIHNDLNPHNVLVDDHQAVAGIIDFGDALKAPLVNDLATALAYHFSDDDDFFRHFWSFIQSYHQQLPLSEAEISLLPLLIASRLVLIMLIAQHRAIRYPENRDYILRNVPYAWRSLSRLNQQSFDSLGALFHEACYAGRRK